jgi:hypothetical protein
MRRLIWIAAAGALLIGGGVAVAHNGGAKSTVKGVGGTFTATSVSNSRTSTCTGSDGGSYQFTRATYTGAMGASSEPSLNGGNVTVDAVSAINTTTNVGTVSGRLRIDAANGTHTNLGFDSVYSAGTLAGWAAGRVSEGGGALLANLSASFSATGGFTNGKLGGTTGGGAVLVARGGCQPGTTTTPKPERVEVHGNVSAVSPSSGTPTSITVAGVTCAVPSTLASQVASVHVGDFVKLECTTVGGTNTLTRIEPSHSDEHHGREHSADKHRHS